MNLNRWIKAISVLIFVVSLALITSPLSANAASSSYQLTCEDIDIYGSVLEATCRRRDQSLNQTDLLLKGIENIDGTLKVTSSWRPANFDQSCDDISIRGDVISARCRTRAGYYVSTSLRLTGIENIDGELQYTSEPTDEPVAFNEAEANEDVERIISEMRADQEFRSHFDNDQEFEDYLNRFRESWN
ncbi:CVNH domain-containing protein [Planktothrix pseudagardhii]|uniref:Cyanovirin-N n=1 Tax=Planktothrix pseudagardhii TaxID=132604 RepID=A0A9W4CMY9_9CYAN|nr:CVNH domain-containing protein [Planktothrix pseudagardhii]CAD5936887.1 Cyanovirin-N [Planktothrix pseudagardhii]